MSCVPFAIAFGSTLPASVASFSTSSPRSSVQLAWSSIVVEAVRRVRVLLNLQDHHARKDRVDRSSRHVHTMSPAATCGYSSTRFQRSRRRSPAAQRPWSCRASAPSRPSRPARPATGTSTRSWPRCRGQSELRLHRRDAPAPRASPAGTASSPAAETVRRRQTASTRPPPPPAYFLPAGRSRSRTRRLKAMLRRWLSHFQPGTTASGRGCPQTPLDHQRLQPKRSYDFIQTLHLALSFYTKCLLHHKKRDRIEPIPHASSCATTCERLDGSHNPSSHSPPADARGIDRFACRGSCACTGEEARRTDGDRDLNGPRRIGLPRRRSVPHRHSDQLEPLRSSSSTTATQRSRTAITRRRSCWVSNCPSSSADTR